MNPDIITGNSDLTGKQSPDPTQKNTPCQPDQDLPEWFMYLFFVMMVLMILSIWFIPEDILLRWSKWWNNISIS